MTNIIKFPGVNDVLDAPDPPGSPQEAPPSPRRLTTAAVANAVVRAVWVIAVLVWPVAKWVVSIDVFFQFLRLLYHWDTPGVHAGWTFVAHFTALTALTYFVSIYKPKGL